jgi:hypothetical protein
MATRRPICMLGLFLFSHGSQIMTINPAKKAMGSAWPAKCRRQSRFTRPLKGGYNALNVAKLDHIAAAGNDRATERCSEYSSWRFSCFWSALLR